MAEKRYGLRLTLGGAPNTPHLVPGLPGYFRPDIPNPVGGDGQISVEDAKAAAEISDVLELVELEDVAKAEQVAAEDFEQGRSGIQVAARESPNSTEQNRLNDEADATSGGNK